jgi:hypothetical protein
LGITDYKIIKHNDYALLCWSPFSEKIWENNKMCAALCRTLSCIFLKKVYNILLLNIREYNDSKIFL